MNESIESMIYLIRGQRVMLDRDLAMLYGVEAKVLNQALKRNIYRFPEDFAFQLAQTEWDSLRSQIVTLDKESSSGRGKYSKYLPHVFTEHGVVMLANVLRSKHAVKMSIEVVRAFIQMRKILVSSDKFGRELHELKRFVLKHAQKSDQEFRKVWQAIERLSAPPNKEEEQIGFDLS
jgi:hypothetical protein